jgi:hypothetical protein
MKYIITESQEKTLKKLFSQLLKTKGLSVAIKSSGGIDKLMDVLDIPKTYPNCVKLVLNDLEINTKLIGHHYYLFDCNISVMLNHVDKNNPRFTYSRPDCFDRIMDERYYFMDRIAILNTMVWEEYSEFIIDRYKNEFVKRHYPR